MTSADSIMQLYLTLSTRSPLVLAHDLDGLPAPLDPAPLLLKVAYIPSGSDLAEALKVAYNGLVSQHTALMMVLPSPDGPPFRMGVIFTYVTRKLTVCKLGLHPKHNVEVDEYSVSNLWDSCNWSSDVQQGKLGHFGSGSV